MRELIILGAGGHGKVCAELAERLGRWQRIFFLDDKHPELERCGAWEVAGAIADLQRFDPEKQEIFIAIGNNETRLRILEEVSGNNWRLPSLIAPEACISKHASVAEACAVLPGAVLACDASLAAGCILNHGATVDHDCVLGRCVHVAPGAHISGEVTIGDCAWIGTGAATRQCLEIGDRVMVGVGAAVVKDVPADVTIMGVPARIIGKELQD